MIEKLNPIELLRPSSRIIIHGEFLYESDQSSSLDNEDRESSVYSLPYHLRRLQIIVSGINFNGLTIDPIKSDDHLHRLLQSIKQHVAQNLYRAYRVNAMLAYVIRVNTIVEEFKYEVLPIISNEQTLLTEGYHPGILDSKTENAKEQIRNIVNTQLVAPLKSWVSSLIAVLNKYTSPRVARFDIKSFTGIIPNEKEKKGSRVSTCLILLKGRAIESLSVLFDLLKEKNLIDNSTTYDQWTSLFQETESHINKILWNSEKPGELRQFIDILTHAKLISKNSSRWATTALHFKLIGDPPNLSHLLKSNTKRKMSQEIIEIAEKANQISKQI